MPRILLSRIGADTLEKLERAATRRCAEARRLAAANERLGALYLYGYSIEMRLKAAYYRLTGVPGSWDIESPRPGSQYSPRKQAQSNIAQLLNLNNPGQTGHHLVGWATLLTDTRSNHALGAYPVAFARDLIDHVQAAGRQWKEILRYRANRPYDEELYDVVDAAVWVQQNYRRLWS